MAPQIEHLAAVVGKVPYVDQGYAVLQEVLGVLNRVLFQGEEKARSLTNVLNQFNSFWKRGVLLTLVRWSAVSSATSTTPWSWRG